MIDSLLFYYFLTESVHSMSSSLVLDSSSYCIHVLRDDTDKDEFLSHLMSCLCRSKPF